MRPHRVAKKTRMPKQACRLLSQSETQLLTVRAPEPPMHVLGTAEEGLRRGPRPNPKEGQGPRPKELVTLQTGPSQEILTGTSGRPGPHGRCRKAGHGTGASETSIIQ